MSRNDGPRFDRQRQAWEKIRQRGKRSFILRRWVLLWGGFMFVVTNCLSYFRHETWKSPVFYLGEALIWCAGGYIGGLWCWHLLEKRFK
jgi:hypothetical protein